MADDYTSVLFSQDETNAKPLVCTVTKLHLETSHHRLAVSSISTTPICKMLHGCCVSTSVHSISIRHLWCDFMGFSGNHKPPGYAHGVGVNSTLLCRKYSVFPRACFRLFRNVVLFVSYKKWYVYNRPRQL